MKEEYLKELIHDSIESICEGKYKFTITTEKLVDDIVELRCRIPEIDKHHGGYAFLGITSYDTEEDRINMMKSFIVMCIVEKLKRNL